MDELSYFRKLEYQNESYEALCKRCGICCGASTSDPCSNLKRLADGAYICAVYENRHGPRQSLSGGMFACVNIRDAIRDGADYPDCPYCHNGA